MDFGLSPFRIREVHIEDSLLGHLIDDPILCS
mgnify:CR=1 FL=1